MTAVLFDVGGTLVDYYEPGQGRTVLVQCFAAATTLLETRGTLRIHPDEVAARMDTENHEATDLVVRPLEERLGRVYFPGEPSPTSELLNDLCAAFIAPMLALGRLNDDALPTLRALRADGIRMAMVSNMPWGCPREPWVGEVGRHGLLEEVPVFVTCRDAGWRKPARPVFELACAKLGVEPADCLFVGDHPVWDVEGALGAGMRAVLLDRKGAASASEAATVKSLWEVVELVSHGRD